MTTSRSRGRKLFGYLGRIGGGLGLALGLMVGTVTVSQHAFATTTSTLYASLTQGTGNCSTITDACSLSTAISQAASGDTIELVTPGTSGTYGAQTIRKSLTVTIEAAPGVVDPTIDGQGISSITVDTSAKLTLIGVTISGNSWTAQSGKSAAGGGIFNGGTVTIYDSTISGNSVNTTGGGVVADGGGIYNYDGTVTISDSTISGNSVSAKFGGDADGGGIYNNDGTVNISDSTISGNSVSAKSGGDADGGGIYNSDTLSLTADLLANPSGACALGKVRTDQYVFTSNSSCDPKGSTDYQSPSVGTDLRNIKVNGVLEMVKPIADNPAIGAIKTSTGLCPPADQRGYVPVSGAKTCDVGAYQTSYVAPAITFSPPSTAVAGTSDSLSATSTSPLPVTFLVRGTSASVCSITGTTVSFHTNGTCTIEASQAGGMDQGYHYAPASSTQSISVSEATQTLTQTITFSSTAPTNAQVGQTYTPVAKSSSGLAVSFGVSPGNVCSISGGVVSFTGAGTCTVTASQGGNSEYGPASTTQNINVSQATQTITFSSTAPTNAQVGQTYTPVARSSSGLAVSFGVSPGNVCSISSGVVSFTGAGTCTVTASQGGNSEYAPASTTQNINVSQATQTITFSSTAPTNAQVGQTYTPAATSSSGLAVSFAVSPGNVCSISSGVVSFTGAGTCTVTASQGGSGEYGPASTTQSVNVVAVPVTSTTSTTPSSTKPSSTTPSTPAPKTSSSTTSAPTTKPQSVTIKTGPPVAPRTTTPLVPIGVGLGASGVLGIFGLNRKRRRAS
ncbi:hypothetical protein [Ferrimicrobium sp.]|uniref:hypothetical protein n=1 Tax=Ferrimicrobium sp. TaxID=2926050 RepID=UPI002617F472|nr:hypothetical protein [Ferrimicrobium sp.]